MYSVNILLALDSPALDTACANVMYKKEIFLSGLKQYGFIFIYPLQMNLH